VGPITHEDSIEKKRRESWCDKDRRETSIWVLLEKIERTHTRILERKRACFGTTMRQYLWYLLLLLLYKNKKNISIFNVTGISCTTKAIVILQIDVTENSS
jgi:hypothetical protein